MKSVTNPTTNSTILFIYSFICLSIFFLDKWSKEKFCLIFSSCLKVQHIYYLLVKSYCRHLSSCHSDSIWFYWNHYCPNVHMTNILFLLSEISVKYFIVKLKLFLFIVIFWLWWILYKITRYADLKFIVQINSFSQESYLK